MQSQTLQYFEEPVVPVADPSRTTAPRNTPLGPESEAQKQQSLRIIELLSPKVVRNGLTPELFAVVGLGFPLLAVGLLFVSEIEPGVVGSWCCVGALAFVSWVVNRAKLASARKAEIEQILERTEDPRLIPYVIDLRMDYKSKRRQTLLRLLPRLSVKDAQRLRSDHWELLHRELQARDESIILTILELIERCGGISSLPYVHPLADGRNSAKQNIQIQQLAKSCEHKLQARLNRLDNPRTLLRGSAAPAAEALLRPAMESADGAPRQLLRAAGDSDSRAPGCP